MTDDILSAPARRIHEFDQTVRDASRAMDAMDIDALPALVKRLVDLAREIEPDPPNILESGITYTPVADLERARRRETL